MSRLWRCESSSPLLPVGSYHSLTSWRKKFAPSLRRQAGLEEALRPGRVLVQEIHRGEDVEEHSEGEEIADSVGVRPGDALDVLDERAVALADDRADLRVVAVGVRLHLGAEASAVVEQLDVSLADRVEGFLAALAGGGVLEELERLAQAAPDDLDVELLLRAEEAEEVRLRDAGPPRDRVGRRAVEPVLPELLERRSEDLLTPDFRCFPVSRNHCAVSYHSLTTCVKSSPPVAATVTRLRLPVAGSGGRGRGGLAAASARGGRRRPSGSSRGGTPRSPGAAAAPGGGPRARPRAGPSHRRPRQWRGRDAPV